MKNLFCLILLSLVGVNSASAQTDYVSPPIGGVIYNTPGSIITVPLNLPHNRISCSVLVPHQQTIPPTTPYSGGDTLLSGELVLDFATGLPTTLVMQNKKIIARVTVENNNTPYTPGQSTLDFTVKLKHKKSGVTASIISYDQNIYSFSYFSDLNLEKGVEKYTLRCQSPGFAY